MTAQVAENVAFTAAGDIPATNVQAAIEELDTEKVGSASPSFTGTVGLERLPRFSLRALLLTTLKQR